MKRLALIALLLATPATAADNPGVKVWSKPEGLKLPPLPKPCGIPACKCGCSQGQPCGCASGATSLPPSAQPLFYPPVNCVGSS
jgi:hypothetical protein